MVTTFYPPYNFGGDGMFIYRLSNALAGQGHEVEVIHCVDAYEMQANGPPSGDYPHHPNVTVHSLKSKGGMLSPLVTQQTGHPGLKNPRLRQLIEDGNFDVINFHNTSLIGLKALTYGSGIKLYTMHEHWLVCPMHVLWKFDREACTQKQCISCTIKGKRPPQLWRYTGFMDSMLDNIDAFIAVSEFSKQKHLEFGLNVKAPIEVIPYFVPLPEVDEVPQTEAPPHPRPYFLFVGRLEKLKGVQNLIETFRRYDKADLLIAGDGSYETELRSQAQGLDHVKFLGRVQYQELQRLYRHAIAQVFSSIGYETLGIVLLEAFLQNTPVIVNDLGAPPEIVEQSGGGLIYENEAGLIEAMELLRNDPNLRTTLGERGREAYYRYWTPEAYMPKYFGLINGIAAKRNLKVSG